MGVDPTTLGAAAKTGAKRPSGRLIAFLASQFISQAGGWGQIIALNWVVIQSGGGALAVGLVTACRQLPLLLVAPLARRVTGVVERRRLLIATQYGLLVLAVLLALVVASGSPSFAILVGLSLGCGLLNGLANPLRQLFLGDLVSEPDRPRAQAMYSVMLSLSRLAGPAMAAGIIALRGVDAAFAANAVSFVFIIVCLHCLTVRSSPDLQVSEERLAIRQGFRVDPGILALLLIVAAVSATALQLPVILPEYVTTVLGGDASGYAAILAVSGAGSIVAGLTMTRYPSTSVGLSRASGLVVAATLVGVILEPSAVPLAALMAVGGAAATACTVIAAARIQSAAAPLRASLMPLYSMASLGIGAVAAPAVGLVAELFGLRSVLVGGAALILLACAFRRR